MKNSKLCIHAWATSEWHGIATSIIVILSFMFSGCFSTPIPPVNVSNVYIHRAPFPPSPSWYEVSFPDQGWEFVSSSLIKETKETLYLRQYFDLGEVGSLVEELILQFPQKPSFDKLYINGELFSLSPETSEKKQFRFLVAKGVLQAKDNVLAMSFSKDQTPHLPEIEAILPESRISPLYIKRGPYLLYPTTQGITVSFEASAPCVGWVEYGDQKKTRVSETKSRYHMLRISDLYPGERFSYRVICESSGKRVESSQGTLTTAPEQNGTAWVAVFSEKKGFLQFAKNSSQLNSLSPDLALLLGGFLPAGENELAWDAFFRAGYSLLQNTAVVPVLSSKQISAAGLRNTASLFALPESTVGAGRAYSLPYGAAHFVILDGDILSIPRIRDWFLQNVKDAKEKKRRVVLVLSNVPWGKKSLSPGFLDQYLPSKEVDLLLISGNFDYQSGTTPQNVPYLILGNHLASGKNRKKSIPSIQLGLLEISSKGIWAQLYQSQGDTNETIRLK